MLLLTTASCINISQTTDGKSEQNSSYYLANCTLAFILIYVIVLFAYLNKKKANLSEQELVNRVGSAYDLLNVKRLAKPALVLRAF